MKWRLSIMFALVALGAALIVMGDRISGLSDYQRSVFVNVGTAVALIGPLFLAERLLSERIGFVKDTAEAAEAQAATAVETVASVARDVATLRERVDQRLAERRGAQTERAERAAAGHFASFEALYNKAAAHRSIHRLGLRLPLPEASGYFLRVRAGARIQGEGSVELSVEGLPFNPTAEMVYWSDGEDGAEATVRLIQAVQDSPKMPWLGDHALRDLIPVAAAALKRIVDLRTGSSGDRDVRTIMSLPSEGWAVTDEGLESLHRSEVYAEKYELNGVDTSHAFNRLEVAVKQWDWDRLDFGFAFDEAVAIHRTLEERRKSGRFVADDED